MLQFYKHFTHRAYNYARNSTEIHKLCTNTHARILVHTPAVQPPYVQHFTVLHLMHRVSVNISSVTFFAISGGLSAVNFIMLSMIKLTL